MISDTEVFCEQDWAKHLIANKTPWTSEPTSRIKIAVFCVPNTKLNFLVRILISHKSCENEDEWMNKWLHKWIKKVNESVIEKN